MRNIFTLRETLMVFLWLVYAGLVSTVTGQTYTVTSGGATYTLTSNSCGGSTTGSCIDPGRSAPPIGATYTYNGTYFIPSNSNYQRGTGNPIVCCNVNASCSRTNPTCNNPMGGVATANASGTGGYSYSWNTGATSSSINGLGPGTYTVTVRASGGCTDICRVTLTLPNSLSANATGATSICPGESATIRATGGSNYNWSNGLGSGATKTVSPTSTTTYTVTVSGNNACSDTDQVTIRVNPVPNANAGNDQSVCRGDCATLNASGGGTYQWSGGLGSEAAPEVCPTSTTNYTVTVTNSDGCTDTDQVRVTVNRNPVVTAGGNTLICPMNGSTTTLTATTTSGSSPYNYQWSGPNGFSSSQQNPSVSADGPYTVVVTDRNGCMDSDEIDVTKVEIEGVVEGPGVRCAGEDAQFQVNPPIPGATYNWTATGNPSVTSGSTSGPSVIFSWPNTPGQYTVTLSVVSQGCTFNLVEDVNITNQVMADAGPDHEVCQGGCAILDGTGSSGFSNVAWTVVSGDITSLPTGQAGTTQPQVCPLFDTEYEIAVTDPINGCITIDRVVVRVDVDLNPIAMATAGEVDCETLRVVLDGTGSLPPPDNPGASLSYLWFNGTNPPSGFVGSSAISTGTVSGPTTFTLVVIADGVCSDTAFVEVDMPDCMSIGSTIFSDNNNNGVQDSGELTLGQKGKNINVDLFDAVTNQLVGTTTTNSNGSYFFNNLNPGSYFVSFLPPASLPVSSSVTDTNDNGQDGDDNGIQNDNNNDGITDGVIRSPVIVLSPGTEPTNEPGANGNKDSGGDANGDMTIDFGLVPLMSIGSTIFSDDNNNGMQDPGELTLGQKGKSVQIDLFSVSGQLVSTTTTNNQGSYIFSNLLPGDYFVSFTPPPSMPVSSTPTDVNDNGQDGDDNGLQSDNNNDGITDGVIMSPTITLTAGQEPTNEPFSNGNKDDFDDVNGDMTIDFGLIPFVDIELKKRVVGASQILVGNQATFNIEVCNNGPSNATNVVVTDVLPNGYTNPVAALGTVSGNTVTWSGINLVVGQCVNLTLLATINIPGTGLDYVNIAEVTSADQMDIDSTPNNGADTNGTGGIGSADNDGTQDNGDEDDGDDAEITPICPVDLQLVKSVANTTMVNGSVFVEFDIEVCNTSSCIATGVQVTDFPSSTMQLTGTSSTTQGNVLGTALWNVGTLVPSQCETWTIEARITGSGNHQNLAEITAINETDSDSTPGNGADNDGDGNVGSVDPDGTQDFGDEDDGDDAIVELVSLGSTIFSDNNDNGFQDFGELTLGQKGKSVQIDLHDAFTGGVVATTTTNANGAYFFNNLLPGSYYVSFVPPASLPISSSNTDTGDNSQDGDDNGIQTDNNNDGITDGTIISPVITLTPNGETTNEPASNGNLDNADDNSGDMTIDFGLVPCSVDLDLIKTIASVNLVNGKYYATYNIRVRNTGNCPATGVEVTDDLPFGFTLMSTSSVSQGSFNGLIWNVGTINPGQTATWTLVAQVGNPGIPHVNTAEITNMNEVDIDSTPGNGADTNGSGGIGSQDGDGTQDFGDEDDGDDAVIDVILPLDLLSFSGHYMKGESANLLQWSTLNEISTEHFEVQRSYEESSDFETIGIIDAYGNSVSKLEYDFIDSSLSEVGTYLYRLKIVSSEGETQFSQVISIEVDKISFVDLVVNIYPNPASDKILIETNAEKGDIVTIEIYDITGEKLLLKNVDFNQQIELNTTDLSSGIYLVKTMIKDKVCIKRLSVTR